MRLRTALAALSLAVSTIVFAADAPKPDPALKQLAYWAHTFQCRGWQNFTGTKTNYTETVTGKWVLDGQWLDLHVTQAKTKENPNPFSGRAYLGYDPAKKLYVVGWVDNTGGYEASESTGWEGDKLTLDGVVHMGAMSAKARDIFTKVSAKKLTHSFELEQDGKFTEVQNETCTRQ